MTDSPSAMPASHEGLAYWHFLADLTKKRGVKRYLEVGVQQGQLMSMIQAERAVGVDPFFNITFNVAKGKKQLSLFQGRATSSLPRARVPICSAERRTSFFSTACTPSIICCAIFTIAKRWRQRTR